MKINIIKGYHLTVTHKKAIKQMIQNEWQTAHTKRINYNLELIEKVPIFKNNVFFGTENQYKVVIRTKNNDLVYDTHETHIVEFKVVIKA